MFVIDRFFSSSLHAKKRTDSNIARTNAVVGTHTFGKIPMTDLQTKQIVMQRPHTAIPKKKKTKATTCFDLKC